MYRLHTEDGVFPLDSLKDYGDYLVHFKGGRLIKHTEKIYIYETAYGSRYALRMADENIVLEYKQYYEKYNCQGIIVGIRKSLKNRLKMNQGDVSLYIGVFDIPRNGERITITPTNPKLQPAGYRM